MVTLSTVRIKKFNQVYNCSGIDEAIINDYFLEDNGYIVNSKNEEVQIFNFILAFP